MSAQVQIPWDSWPFDDEDDLVDPVIPEHKCEDFGCPHGCWVCETECPCVE